MHGCRIWTAASPPHWRPGITQKCARRWSASHDEQTLLEPTIDAVLDGLDRWMAAAANQAAPNQGQTPAAGPLLPFSLRSRNGSSQQAIPIPASRGLRVRERHRGLDLRARSCIGRPASPVPPPGAHLRGRRRPPAIARAGWRHLAFRAWRVDAERVCRAPSSHGLVPLRTDENHEDQHTGVLDPSVASSYERDDARACH